MLCRTGYAEPAPRDAALKNHPHATIGIFWAQAVSTPTGTLHRWRISELKCASEGHTNRLPNGCIDKGWSRPCSLWRGRLLFHHEIR